MLSVRKKVSVSQNPCIYLVRFKSLRPLLIKNDSILYSFQFDNKTVNNKWSYLHKKFI